MIAVDTNILVYAHRSDSPFHARARECIKALAEGRQLWAIPWPCVHEFYNIVTHPKIWKTPSPIERAIDQIEAWREAPGVLFLGETDWYWQALRELLERAKITGPKVHDARIAALCIANDVAELWTADRDFSRFPKLRVANPLHE